MPLGGVKSSEDKVTPPSKDGITDIKMKVDDNRNHHMTVKTSLAASGRDGAKEGVEKINTRSRAPSNNIGGH